jgi:DNA-binding helix-hairpin-helix protein with protein kinase domain
MPEAYDKSGKLFAFGARLASGGQGVVWKLSGNERYLAKIYHTPPSSRESAKCRLLQTKADALKGVAALPFSLAFSDHHRTTPIGVFIPYVAGIEVFELFGTASRLQHFPKANFKYLVRVAYNIAAAFEELHEQGIIVGDVNEQNIKVLPDATVRLIDCDSFQLSDGTTIHTSDVGTPLWTAPELHGQNLTGFVRSQNHDLFGLAQLIFLLLFTGRYPFAGVPRTQKALLPEEAIQQYAFAFAPLEMNLPLGPPPGSPRLEMLPPFLREAFQKAFLKGSSLQNARPKAAQWRAMLDTLSKDLVSCSHNSSHIFWVGASNCPWCQILKTVGVDVFPAADNSSPDLSSQFQDNDSYVTRLANLRPFPFVLKRTALFNDLRPMGLPPRPTGFWSGFHKMISLKAWKENWLGARMRACGKLVRENEARLTELILPQQNLIANYERDFRSNLGALNVIINSLGDTDTIRNQCIASVKLERRNTELTAYLRWFYIRNSKIPQIGPNRKATLASFGIETAADVNAQALYAAGLPSNAVEEVLDWRSSMESNFNFNPNQVLTPAQLVDVDRRLSARLKKTREDAAAIEVKLNELKDKTKEKLRLIEVQIFQISREMAQAKIDLAFMEQELSKH